MDPAELIARLTALGVGPQVSAAYVQLLRMGPSKASDIATGLKISRAEAYRTLQRMVQDDLATATLKRPIRFAPRAPDELLSKLSDQADARRRLIDDQRGTLVQGLTAISSAVPELPQQNRFRIIQGRNELYGTLQRMFRESRDTIRALNTHSTQALLADVTGAWEAGMARHADGVRGRLLVRATPDAPAKLAAMPRLAGVQIRQVTEERPMRFYVTDDRELLLSSVLSHGNQPEAPGDVAIWTDAQDLVGTLSALFDCMWERAAEPVVIDDAERESDRSAVAPPMSRPRPERPREGRH